MTVAGPRIVLFLQGPLSPLFARIGAELRQAGHRVHRIDLSVGDALHWRGGGAESYRGSLDDWQQHVGRRIGALGVTDLVLHNHLRPYHAAALAAAAPPSAAHYDVLDALTRIDAAIGHIESVAA